MSWCVLGVDVCIVDIRATSVSNILDALKDLMVLECYADKINIRFNTEGGDIVCTNEHPVITMITEDPPMLQDCLLQGWPPHCI